MHLGALGFLLAGAIVLATQTAAETQSVTAGVINRLPGEARDRLRFIQEVVWIYDPVVIKNCTLDEIEFEEIEWISLYVGYQENKVPPRLWTDEQRRLVDELEIRWETLGGDSRSVSPSCEAAIYSASKR